MAIKSNRNDYLHFNGLNGSTGEYGLPPMSRSDLSQLVHGEADAELLEELFEKHEQRTAGMAAPVREGVRPWDLTQAGWGVIFAHNDPRMPEIKEALHDLLKLRQQQAGELFRTFAGEDAYHVGETKNHFLRRHGVGPGPVDPDRGVPYYLLLVGSPEEIPYSFQYQLDVQFAVGRIYFPMIEDYANYAHSIVSAETGGVQRPRKLGLFGVINPNDPATELSADLLVRPISRKLRKRRKDWEIETVVGEDTTKPRLSSWLGGDETPALFFTASHGMLFRQGSARQIPHQGALVCREWPGRDGWQGPIPEDFYFAGDDIAEDAQLHGMMTFHFSCFSAGTPLNDDFSLQAGFRQQIAPHPFLGGLPMRLLSHARGGALAFIGHVDLAFGYSFDWHQAGEQTTVFVSTLERLMKGFPVGYAFENFDLRYAELATELNEALRELEYDVDYIAPEDLAEMWTAHNDARNYVILGDPAARLPVDKVDKSYPSV